MDGSVGVGDGKQDYARAPSRPLGQIRASIKVEYLHGTGAASMHLLWSNPAAKSPGVLKIVPSDSLVSSS
ncbi:hypothetical protein HDG34_002343 [Paraburkholderia sp. HC6.4b]|uniref:hypothetical protein n=1 Tax=unclassified Paraburkholderia TaxID=2615204 RepID=UPI001621571E|nr:MULTISPECIES: hypothetical protein [unclassified Paraburkholderia]MBB5408407.1 hypothetical protein [Paraburkholderia sp. HC6.4b]MBB5451512.1 hypothetical protein [Paraburkholderia sp. Kb1A]